MSLSHTMRRLQQAQYVHDRRNHEDIWALHKVDRLKHYALHYAKYAGRLARGLGEAKPFATTVSDVFLINLSAANTLKQDLSNETFASQPFSSAACIVLSLTEAVGRFADACEKIDHLELEDAAKLLKSSNRDIAEWVVSAAETDQLDLGRLVAERRKELHAKQFYIAD